MHFLVKLTARRAVLYKWFFVALALGSMLPFLALSFYSYPVADDYVFSAAYKEMGWLAFQSHFYQHWQGLYTTNALMCSALNPMVHNRFDLYWVPCWLSLASLLASVALLMRYLTRDSLATWVLTCSVVVLYLYQVPSPAEALYWLNANWAYQMSISLGVMWLLLLLKTFAQGQVRRAYWVVSALLTVLLIGTNFIAAMLAACGVGVGFLLSLRHRATRVWWLGLLGLAGGALLVVVLAPGNLVRLQTEAGGVNPLTIQTGRTAALLHAVTHGIGLLVYSLINWLGNGVVLAVSGLLVPVLVKISRNPEAPITTFFRNRMALVGAGALLVALPFFPTYVTQGGPPAARVANVAYIVFIFVWIFGLYAAIAWRQRAAPAASRQPAYVTVALGAFLLFALLTDANYSLTYLGKGRDFNNIALAYRDWLGGTAGRFGQQQQQRYQLMRAPGQAAVVLDSLSAIPRTIFFDDLHPDSTHWVNRAYASFFGKASVRVMKKAR